MENASNCLLRILLENTKFPLFVGFVECNKNYLVKYAKKPMQNTQF